MIQYRYCYFWLFNRIMFDTNTVNLLGYAIIRDIRGMTPRQLIYVVVLR